MSDLTFVRNGDILSLVVADNFFSRARGLLGRTLRNDQGMLIEPCSAVHTFGMSHPIDVLYLDRDNRIVKIVEHLPPWRGSACRGARKVLELSAGRARHLKFFVGERLFEPQGT